MVQKTASSPTPDAAPTKSELEWQAHMDAHQFRSLKGEANIPKRHDTPFGMRQQGEWRIKYDTLCKCLFERRGAMIAIIGPRGTGKTQMAVDALNLWMHKAKLGALYARAFDVFAAIKETYRENARHTEIDAIKKFASIPMLVIDEMQVRSETDWENSMLTSILDQRYMYLKYTIMIANLEHDAFMKHVGASVYDRVVETGGVISCTWESFR